MKKKTPYYATGLLVLALATYIFFPNMGLSAQEVIQNASANYEGLNQKNKIYHEKRLDQHFSREDITDQSLQEIWINPATGEILETHRNPEDNTLGSASGSSRQGDAYEFPVQELDESEDNSWMKTFWGEKFICKASATGNDAVAVSILKIAADDPTVNVVSGMSYEANEDSEKILTERLMESSSLKTIQDVLKTFSSGSDVELEYEKNKEDGIDYYVFTEHFQDSDDAGAHNGIVKNYFNATTFKLEKTKKIMEDNPEEVDVSTYILVEELDNTSSESIFNFENYGMKLSAGIDADAPKNILESEDGCYSPANEKLSSEEEEKLLNQIDEEKIDTWKNLTSKILSAQNNTASDFIRPTTGYITQGFHTGHNGIDIADGGAMPDVVAVADGVVIETGTGWSDGDGNNVWIDHGNGYKTHYAHLHEFSVQVGDTVKQGQVIGTMGKTGRVYGKTGIFLHFEVQLNGENINPSSILEIN